MSDVSHGMHKRCHCQPLLVPSSTWLVCRSSSQPLNGKTDEVRLWSVARSASQIASTHCTQLPDSDMAGLLVRCLRPDEAFSSDVATGASSCSTF